MANKVDPKDVGVNTDSVVWMDENENPVSGPEEATFVRICEYRDGKRHEIFAEVGEKL